MPASKETEWQRRNRRIRERAEHVAKHGPACQICGNVPKRGLDQDHDHKTGETRGWLCHACNRKLWPGVTPAWLVRAALYLCGFSFGRLHDTVELVLDARRVELRREL